MPSEYYAHSWQDEDANSISHGSTSTIKAHFVDKKESKIMEK